MTIAIVIKGRGVGKSEGIWGEGGGEGVMGDVDGWGKGIGKWGEGGEGVWPDGEAVVIIIRLSQHKLSLL